MQVGLSFILCLSSGRAYFFASASMDATTGMEAHSIKNERPIKAHKEYNFRQFLIQKFRLLIKDTKFGNLLMMLLTANYTTRSFFDSICKNKSIWIYFIDKIF